VVSEALIIGLYCAFVARRTFSAQANHQTARFSENIYPGSNKSRLWTFKKAALRHCPSRSWSRKRRYGSHQNDVPDTLQPEKSEPEKNTEWDLISMYNVQC